MTSKSGPPTLASLASPNHHVSLSDIASSLVKYITFSPVTRIFIDGLTCTGKSSFASALSSQLATRRRNVCLLSTDMFLIPRTQRNYRANSQLMDLANWYDYDQVARVLPTVLSGREAHLTFQAYERSTGRQSRTVSVDYQPVHDLLVFEGYSTTTFLEQYGDQDERDLLIFFSAAPRRIYERITARNTYIDSERREFETFNIYYPSFAQYIDHLRRLGTTYDLVVDTTNFDSIEVSVNAPAPRFE